MDVIEKILNAGEKYMGIKRYDWSTWQELPNHEENLNEFNKRYGNNNKAPFYCSNDTLPNLNNVKENGLVCWGLTNLLLREAGVKLPFKQAHQKYGNNIPGIRFGHGGSDEWIYLFQDNGLEPFNEDGKYPKGTILIRNFDRLTEGHTAILMEDSTGLKSLEDCMVIHSVGDGLAGEGNTPGVCKQKVKKQQEWFKPHYSPWDHDNKYPSVPEPGFNYYQAVLKPEYYINKQYDDNFFEAVNTKNSINKLKREIYLKF